MEKPALCWEHFLWVLWHILTIQPHNTHCSCNTLACFWHPMTRAKDSRIDICTLELSATREFSYKNASPDTASETLLSDPSFHLSLLCPSYSLKIPPISFSPMYYRNAMISAQLEWYQWCLIIPNLISKGQKEQAERRVASNYFILSLFWSSQTIPLSRMWHK